VAGRDIRKMAKPVEVITNIEKAKGKLEFLPTGFKKLDKILDGGFLRKEMVILGGFSGTGKSFFAGQVLLNIAMQGFKSIFFSLEITNETIMSRWLGSLAKINPTLIRSGMLTKQQFEAKSKAKAQILASNDDIVLYDNIYKYEEIEKIVRKEKPDFIVLDFIQNIIMEAKDEYTRLSRTSLSLQQLAKEADTCILVASQLSNSFAKESLESSTIEYKGSGNIVTVADLAFVMKQTGETTFELGLQKNRRGISRTLVTYERERNGGYIYEI
jgi:replicative DNA helicase